jgi:hypothetical protein
MMSIVSAGPLEVLVVEFPGNKFTGEIVPALRTVVDKGIIRVIDLVFITKDAEGTVTTLELGDLDMETATIFNSIAADVAGLLSPEDIRSVAGMMHANSSVGMLVFEHTWATAFRDAVVNADGRLIIQERIPYAVVEAALQAQLAGSPA